MKIDFSHDTAYIYSEWVARYHRHKTDYYRNVLEIFGEHGAGMTSAIQDYISAHKTKARYFSFAGMNGETALSAFAGAFRLDKENPASWDEAGQLFFQKYHKKKLHIFLDDLAFFPQQREFQNDCFPYMKRGEIVVSVIERRVNEEWYQSGEFFDSIYIGWRTLADYCRYFPDYSKQDVVRLFSLTGGVLTILEELDEHAGMEENLRTILRYDSAFSRFVPEWLGEYFRTPESYYPILNAMANGKHRLSEIARYVGYQNNKCQTYLQALMEANLVRTETTVGSKYVTYHLTNSSVAAWCLFVYRNRSQQVADPDGFLRQVMENIDEKLALPALYRSCTRYLERHWKLYLFPYQEEKTIGQKNGVEYRFKNGSTIKLNYVQQIEARTLVGVMPENLDKKYTKKEIQRIRFAVSRLETLYNTDIVVFSLHRFSDWCVHEARINDFFHPVTVERLKY